MNRIIQDDLKKAKNQKNPYPPKTFIAEFYDQGEPRIAETDDRHRLLLCEL